MILSCEIYEFPYKIRKEIVENIFSSSSENISENEKTILNYLKDNEEVEFGELLINFRDAAIDFFETIQKRDAQKYIEHLKKTGQAKYIPCFEEFAK